MLSQSATNAFPPFLPDIIDTACDTWIDFPKYYQPLGVAQLVPDHQSQQLFLRFLLIGCTWHDCNGTKACGRESGSRRIRSEFAVEFSEEEEKV